MGSGDTEGQDGPGITSWFCDTTVGDRFPGWTRGNAADVFPDPISPTMKTLYLDAGLSNGLRDAYISMGVLDWDEFENPTAPEMFKTFGGYLYNPLTLTRLLGARMPGVTPEAIDAAFFDDRDDVPPYVAEPWHESERHAALLGESMAWAMSTDSLPGVDADKVLIEHLRDARPDLSSLTDAALVARARAMVPYMQQAFENGMVASSLASLGPGALQAICDGLGDPSLAIRLLAGIDVDSAAPSYAMWDLAVMIRSSEELTSAFEGGLDDLLDRLRATDSDDARGFVAGFEQLLHDYGSRGPNEWDVIAHSWEVRPRTALAAIDRMRVSDDTKSPRTRNAAAVVERDRVLADIRERIAGDAETAGTFEAALRSAQLFLSARERYKTNCIMLVGEIRMPLRELGRRLVARGVLDDVDQVFMLTAIELDLVRHEPDRVSVLARERWAQYRELLEFEPVFIVNGTVPPLTAMRRRAARDVEVVAAGTVLTGAAGSGGVATGRARVVLDAADPSLLEPGDVLIAPQTDPSWVPLFVPASAVIVNVGAMGSHAMIVSRELGIPCVVSVEDATLRIPDGAMVTVDGNAGTVTIH